MSESTDKGHEREVSSNHGDDESQQLPVAPEDDNRVRRDFAGRREQPSKAARAGSGGADRVRGEPDGATRPDRDGDGGGSRDSEEDDAELSVEVAHIEAIVQRVTHELQFSSSFTGPMPPPEEIEKYQKYIPDAGERFMQIVEARTTQVSGREDRIADQEIRNSHNGIVIAAWITFVCIGIAAGAIFTGRTAGAGIILSIPLVMLVRAFIGDRFKRPPKDDD